MIMGYDEYLDNIRKSKNLKLCSIYKSINEFDLGNFIVILFKNIKNSFITQIIFEAEGLKPVLIYHVKENIKPIKVFRTIDNKLVRF